ncbi:hypothetical protein D9M68_930000 [compost metagenome]
MGQSALFFGFQDRAGLNHQPQLGPVFRFCVLPDIIGKTIGQLSDLHGRIHGQLVGKADFLCIGPGTYQ